MAAGHDSQGSSKQGRLTPQRASEFCATLLAIAGHDLRQPLQILVGVHGWLDSRLKGDSEREYLRRGGLAIERLNGQIDQLVDAVRLYEQASSVRLAPVSLAPVFAELMRDNIDMARSRGIDLRVCGTSAAVISEATLLSAALRNLVHNALKYTPGGGRIVVGCRRHGEETSIEVHDSGIGIPDEQLSRVFEAFHRLDVTRQDGLGLGLFVVKKIVDLLEHSIDLRSRIGRGSCFALRASTALEIDGRRGRGGIDGRQCATSQHLIG